MLPKYLNVLFGIPLPDNTIPRTFSLKLDRVSDSAKERKPKPMTACWFSGSIDCGVVLSVFHVDARGRML